jgi:hypothetical protein
VGLTRIVAAGRLATDRGSGGAGPDGSGPAVWKILVAGPAGIEDRYGAREFLRADAAQITAWLEPIVGPDAATELATAVDAEPPHSAAWQRKTDGY